MLLQYDWVIKILRFGKDIDGSAGAPAIRIDATELALKMLENLPQLSKSFQVL
jgi:hypothetical protein